MVCSATRWFKVGFNIEHKYVDDRSCIELQTVNGNACPSGAAAEQVSDRFWAVALSL